jgi:hypothetical protein
MELWDQDEEPDHLQRLWNEIGKERMQIEVYALKPSAMPTGTGAILLDEIPGGRVYRKTAFHNVKRRFKNTT